MATITIIGNGRCPKCESKTEIKSIESFPFPDDEQIETIEACTSCDFKIEKGFFSTNATTSFFHSIDKELKNQEKKINRVLLLGLELN